jgi:hypothetical protein
LLLTAAAEELDVSEGELRSVPVLWVQLDQAQEWLAAVTLRQPAHWWALQVRYMMQQFCGDMCRDFS